MSRLVKGIAGSAMILMLVGVVSAAGNAMKEDRGHVYTWNKFTDDLYALHQRLLADRRVKKEVTVGGYAERPAFYRQEKYFDEATGRLLSTIQWEANNSSNIHAIAVYRYDDRGRLIRDYSSTYLPDYRNAPTQTLIFLHRYNDELHAWRSFDASDELLNEQCKGTLDGEDVYISLDIDEIEQARAERYQHHAGILTHPAYMECFKGMPDSAKDALPPN